MNTSIKSNIIRTYGKYCIKLGITIILFIFLYLKTDWNQIKSTLSHIQIIPFIISYLLLLLCTYPLAQRLTILLEPTMLKFSIIRLIQIQFISQFYSILLPSGVGVSIARWYKITENQHDRKALIIITMIEYAMIATTLLLCTGIPLIFATNEAIQPFRKSVLPVIFTLLSGCLLFFVLFMNTLVHDKFTLLMKRIQSKFRSTMVTKITDIYHEFGMYVNKKQLILEASVFHLVYQTINLIRFYLVFIALGIELSPFTIMWISMIVLLILVLPISIGGLGMRETGFAWFLTLYGIEPEKGILLGGMISIQMLLNVGIGAVLNIFEKRQTNRNQGLTHE